MTAYVYISSICKKVILRTSPPQCSQSDVDSNPFKGKVKCVVVQHHHCARILPNKNQDLNILIISMKKYKIIQV